MTAPPPTAAEGDVVAPGRPRRADAVKNRQRILAAAEEVFAVEGLAVPVDTVAERAGVGVGTLYRHFPTKEALFEAIVMTRLEALVCSARDWETRDDPAAAFFSFVTLLADEVTTKHDIFDAIAATGIDIKTRCSALVDELKLHLQSLLEKAVAEGAVRGDVTADEVVGLVMGACHAVAYSGLPKAACDHMLGVICDGLRPPSARPPG